ncbi:hypothetical protein [Phyllobacterium endophyticum]|uniref:Uncharacterized protein n=1 Tax=Phyllobacterium endophyticum TaxID=1149773 RepID=A0A2P7AQS5_9HYPH|nr:hypothetical protein [Phyllobacterium endophyticum]MBB3237014.1 hypothetical protein [Phyllobacterium endophyticum]PSH56584.1 hypothetical protein CU100_14475 [Phyllobacterium endophyticum]TYR44417.1 hypothetical protein FY050_04675 [Phyllobacterium endophyticum]
MSNKTLAGELLPAAGQTQNRLVTVEDLRVKLNSAVEIAFLYGATDWVRLNHPFQYKRLLMRFDDSTSLENRRYYH